MNFHELLGAEVKRTAAEYKAGRITIEQIRARQKRLSQLRSRSFNLERIKESARKTAGVFERALERLREALAEGGPIVAMDTGYTNDGPVEELGITIWENGETRTTNYLIPEVVESRTYPCLYGDTQVVSRNHMLHIAQEAYKSARIAIFHSASVEIRKLELTQSTFWTDTSFLGLVWYNDYPSLELLCQRYGIQTAFAHNSGNDSYRTLQVALSIVEDKRPKRLNY